MATNRGVAYIGPGKVEVKSIEYPKLRMPKSDVPIRSAEKTLRTASF